MTWIKAILLALKLLDKFVTLLRERELLEAGEAKAIAKGLKISNDRTRKAIEARRRAMAGVPNPDDPYNRD